MKMLSGKAGQAGIQAATIGAMSVVGLVGVGINGGVASNIVNSVAGGVGGLAAGTGVLVAAAPVAVGGFFAAIGAFLAPIGPFLPLLLL